MSRFEVIHENKGLAFGNDHACGEFLMIWKRPTNPKARRDQDRFGPDPEEILVDLDTMFNRDFDRPMMERIIAEHGFALKELERVKLGAAL